MYSINFYFLREGRGRGAEGRGAKVLHKVPLIENNLLKILAQLHWLCWMMIMCLLTMMVSTFTLAVLDDDVSVEHDGVDLHPGCDGG